MSAMKILLVGSIPPPHGGVQVNVAAIRTYLRAKGIPCSVINFTRHRQPERDGIYYPKSAPELLRLLWRLDYDIAHLHFGGNLSTRLVALALASCLVPGKKTVLTFHSGGYPRSERGRKARPRSLRGFVLRRLDGLIGVNAEIAKLYERYGVPTERIRMIEPHAVSAPPAGVELPATLRAFFEAHTPVLMSVGGLEPEYDLPIQIEALGRLRAHLPLAGLAILGTGSMEENLRARIRSLPYAEHILLAGDVPHSATLKAIAECDLMLRTTLYDGDSISVREALHLGTPVIATDNGLRPAGVRLIPVGDLEKLYTAILEGIAAPRGEAQTGSNDANIRAVFEFYQELLAAGAADGLRSYLETTK